VNELDALKEAATKLLESSKEIDAAIKQLIAANEQNARAAIEAIQRPKRIIREKGRIVGVE
jgi:hypothetical protein